MGESRKIAILLFFSFTFSEEMRKFTIKTADNKIPLSLPHFLAFQSNKIFARGGTSAARDRDILDRDNTSRRTRDSDIDRCGSRAGADFEEVISLSRCAGPSRSAIGTDFETRDWFVRVDDLHAEPIGRDAFFVMEFERSGDGALYDLPGNVDNTEGLVGEGGEGIGEEVKMVGSTAGALIDNL